MYKVWSFKTVKRVKPYFNYRVVMEKESFKFLTGMTLTADNMELGSKIRNRDKQILNNAMNTIERLDGLIWKKNKEINKGSYNEVAEFIGENARILDMTLDFFLNEEIPNEKKDELLELIGYEFTRPGQTEKV